MSTFVDDLKDKPKCRQRYSRAVIPIEQIEKIECCNGRCRRSYEMKALHKIHAMCF